MNKIFDPNSIRHYSSYVALYAGYVVRYFMMDDPFNARRCAALFETSLELAAGHDLPPEEKLKKPKVEAPPEEEVEEVVQQVLPEEAPPEDDP